MYLLQLLKKKAIYVAIWSFMIVKKPLSHGACGDTLNQIGIALIVFSWLKVHL